MPCFGFPDCPILVCSPHVPYCANLPVKDEFDIALLVKHISSRLLFALKKTEGLASEKSARSHFESVLRFVSCACTRVWSSSAGAGAAICKSRGVPRRRGIRNPADIFPFLAAFIVGNLVG